MDNFVIEIDDLIKILFSKNKNSKFIVDIFYSELEKVKSIWDKYKMYLNIQEHCKIVAIIAVYLILNIKKSKTNYYYRILNNYLKSNNFEKIITLIIDAALLHDIGKIFEIENIKKLSHSEIGYQILIQENRFLEAFSCKYHLINSFINLKLPLIPFIINLADKLVLHTKIVSIKERFIDLRQRYPSYLKFFSKESEKSYEKAIALFHIGKLNKVILMYNL